MSNPGRPIESLGKHEHTVRCKKCGRVYTAVCLGFMPCTGPSNFEKNGCPADYRAD